MEHSQSIDQQSPNLAWMTETICRAITRSSSSDLAREQCIQVAQTLGFDGLSYLVVRPCPVGAELITHWTTADARWRNHYRRHAFHAIDPRVTNTIGRLVPIIWADAQEHHDPQSRAFQVAANAHFIRGGAAMSVSLERGQRAIFAWDLREPPQDPFRASMTGRALATLALMACCLHDSMAGKRPARPHSLVATSLTTREQACLTLASRGMTSRDISIKLTIAERTVNFHMGNVVDKLGALNRGEAIARGIALNLISFAESRAAQLQLKRSETNSTATP